MEDYRPKEGIFSDRNSVAERVKRVVQQRLSPIDRNIILLYCEDASVSKTAKRFNVSKSTMLNELHRIKRIIKSAL